MSQWHRRTRTWTDSSDPEHPKRLTLETWFKVETHGTVEEEMAQNGWFQCECGKMHGKWSGWKCDACDRVFPEVFDMRQMSCRR